MTDFDISRHHHHQQQTNYGDKDKGNISIKHTTGHHSHNVTQRDQVEASSSLYQEEYIPAVDNPALETYDPQASKTQPKTKPDQPRLSYQSHLKELAQEMPTQLTRFLGATNPKEAQAMLRFLQHNPGTGTPATLTITATLAALADMATELTDGKSAFSSTLPNSEKLNGRIGEHLSKNFNNLVKEQFSGSDAKLLTFCFNHPEYRDQLSPELQQSFDQLQEDAYAQTQLKEGFPDGWEPPLDPTYDNMVGAFYDRVFDELTQQDHDLTPQERKSLRTLHRFPNAKVPGRDELLETLKNFNARAKAAAQQRFALPGKFKLSPQADVYKAAVMGGFKHHFTKQVLAKLQKGELTQSQAQILHNSKGVDPAKIPSNLMALYTQIRQTASKQTAGEFQLPDKWEPSPTASGQKASDVSGNGEPTTVKNADGSIRIRANTRVQGKTDKTAALDEIQAPNSNRDYGIAHNAIDYFQEAMGISEGLTEQYMSGPENMSIMDAMKTVSEALNNLRESVYAQQEATAKVGKALEDGQIDTNLSKIRQQEIDRKKALEQQQQQDNQKQSPFYQFLETIPFLGKLIEDTIKLFLWAVNVVTGGAIGMICQACGAAPVYENPLEMMGAIDHEQAETMDFALGIIMTVVEIVASVLTAQPELVMAEVAEIIANVAEMARSVASRIVEEGLKTVITSALKTAGRVISETASDVAKSIARTFSKTIPDALKAAMKSAEESLKQGVATILKNAMKKIIKAIQQASRKAKDWINNKFFDIVDDVKRAFIDLGKAIKQEFKLLTEDVALYMKTLAIDTLHFLQDFIVGYFRGYGQMFSIYGKVGKGIAKGVTERLIERGVINAGGKALAKREAREIAENLVENTLQREGKETAEEVAEEGAEEGAEAGAKGEIGDAADAGADAADGAAGASGKGGAGKAGKKEKSPMLSEDEKPEIKLEDKSEPPKTEKEESVVEEDEVAENLDEEGSVSQEDAQEIGEKEKTLEELTKEEASKKATFKEKAVKENAKAQARQETEFKEALKDQHRALRTEEGFKEFQKALKHKAEKMAETFESRALKSKLKPDKENIKDALKGKTLHDAKVMSEAFEKEFDKNMQQIMEKVNSFEGKPDEWEKFIDEEFAKIYEKNDIPPEKALDEVKSEVKSSETAAKEAKIIEKSAKNFAKGVTSSTTSKTVRSIANSADTELEEATRLIRKLHKKQVKRQQAREDARRQFFVDTKEYINGTVQFSTDVVRTVMSLRQSEAQDTSAEGAAFIQEMDTYLAILKRGEDSILKSMDDLASWINDINSQESMYWKKMEIRYIAA